MNVGSLFSGIGGFDYGLERAGMRVAWQCEADEFCQRALAERWPGVPCYPDVRELTGATVEPVDVLCGGFPCQDISLAGKGAGIGGARSGLWGEYARLVGELRPRYVIVENVAALLTRGLGRVVGDLAALGYDAEWDCLPASAFGAPHRRDRLWIVAYPERSGRAGWPHQFGRDDSARDAAERREGAGDVAGGGSQGRAPADADGGGRIKGKPDLQARESDAQGRGAGPGTVPDSDAGGREIGPQLDSEPQEDSADGDSRGGHADRLRDEVADADSAGRAGWRRRNGVDAAAHGDREDGRIAGSGGTLGELQDADECAVQPWRIGGRAAQAGGSEWWAVEPPVGRVAHGVPDRLAQLAAYGNALVPQIAEWLGTQILDYEANVNGAHAPP